MTQNPEFRCWQAGAEESAFIIIGDAAVICINRNKHPINDIFYAKSLIIHAAC